MAGWSVLVNNSLVNEREPGAIVSVSVIGLVSCSVHHHFEFHFFCGRQKSIGEFFLLTGPRMEGYNVDTNEDSDIATEKSRQKDEILGWTLDSAARGVVVMATAVFVSSELLRLAKEATGCIGAEDEMFDEYCADSRVYGMRPSSLLTNIVMVTGLLSAFIMPLCGSIIDHTDLRRAAGSLSAAVLAILVLIQMLVMHRFWFLAAILQVFIAASYTVHLTVVYAYFPELSQDHTVLAEYAARFAAFQYGTSVIFLIFMVAVLATVDRETVNSATISQAIVFVVCLGCFGYSWNRLFRPRQATQKVPEGSTLVTAGFRKILRTAKTILQNHDAIKWLLLSVAFTEAATTTFSTIAITYMTEQLNFTAEENGVAILILLLFSVPGAKIAAYLTRILNPIKSLQACLTLWIVTISAAAICLDSREQMLLAYGFAALWGTALGWTFPTEKTLYVTIIPRGQEAELMGTYICACQVISWLPPLVFTLLNEAGYPMRVGVCSLTAFFLSSLLILFLMGDYGDAVTHARAIDEERTKIAKETGTNELQHSDYKELA
jgi:MFS-type transporter involved in bile tolerance (Atg22 family)